MRKPTIRNPHMSVKRSIAAAMILFAGALPPALGSIQYTITDLGSLGGPTSAATCINNNGLVAGSADDQAVDPYSHAWVWTGSGALQNLGSFGGQQSVSFVTGLNDNGWVIGMSDTYTNGPTHSFLWTGSGTIQDIGTLGGQQTNAWAINDAGTIVGQSQNASGGVACLQLQQRSHD